MTECSVALPKMMILVRHAGTTIVVDSCREMSNWSGMVMVVFGVPSL